MIYILKLLGLLFIFCFSDQSIAMNNDEEDFSQIKKLEGFLVKNKKDMVRISKGLYEVGEQEFDDIFPPCSLILEPFPLYAVGKVTSEYIQSTNVVQSHGTGTIIKNTGDSIEYITAKHVIERGTTSFSIIFRTSPLEKKHTILAEYIEDEVFIHPSLDIAIIRSNLVSSIIPKEKLAVYKIDIDFSKISGKKKVSMYHYPWAVEDQRVNTGFILDNVPYHTVPTLPSSSGASLITNNKIVGIHIEAGDEFPKIKVELDKEKLDMYNHNNFLRLDGLNTIDFQKLKR